MGFANAGRRAAGDRYAFPLAFYEDLRSLSTREVNNAREVAANPIGVFLSLSIAVSVSVGCAIFIDIHGIRKLDAPRDPGPRFTTLGSLLGGMGSENSRLLAPHTPSDIDYKSFRLHVDVHVVCWRLSRKASRS